jgi:hypothetical protein
VREKEALWDRFYTGSATTTETVRRAVEMLYGDVGVVDGGAEFAFFIRLAPRPGLESGNFFGGLVQLDPRHGPHLPLVVSDRFSPVNPRLRV